MMRTFVAATLTAGVLALVACETVPRAAAEPDRATAAIPQADASPAIVSRAPTELEPAELLESPPVSDARAMLDESHVVETERGLMLTLEDGTFDSQKAIIKPAAGRGLDMLAKFLHDNPGRRVQIEAFTDGEGASVYNLELSQDRADAVALAVIDRGIDPARVRAVGWGERFPVAGNDTEENRQRNRRVEITVSKGDAAVPVRVVNAP
jgi:outer membrane protein OmpA-like peptidoglycan-associated protein